MMKRFNKIYSILTLVATLSLVGCIEETFPESEYATEGQMSNAGLSSAVDGLNSQYAQGYLVYGVQEHETDMAYPQFMIAQTEMQRQDYHLHWRQQ